MQCEICQKRPANIHQTQQMIKWARLGRVPPGEQPYRPPLPALPSGKTERHLCDVCAGWMTEQQLEEQAALLEQQSRQRREKNTAWSQAISKELFGDRIAELRSNGFFTYLNAVSMEWKLCLLAVGSRKAENDPMELFFGPSHRGKNHALRQVGECDVYFIRWDSDPQQMMRNAFELFPNAGPRLDLESRLLFVEGELDLFPNNFRSITYCSFAASIITTSLYPVREPRFEFKLQKHPRLSDALPFKP
jgi:hypothetical protein